MVKTGDALPADVKLMELGDAGPKQVTLGELTKGKTLVLFAVPGAFTPTCSMKHLPGFVQKAADIRGKGVDEIVCLSVNDAFVMGAWGKDQGAAGKVRMVADGNGELTKALGLEMDASGFGMGLRSKRYAMVVKDGKVMELLVEPAGGLNVSSAESVLGKLG
jgi:glutaredoxin/glutathione-dependent peroxiredoxin